MNTSTFGLGQLLNHTPAWAKKILLALYALTTVIGAISTQMPSVIPAAWVGYAALASGILTIIFNMFGIKPTAGTDEKQNG